MASSCSLSISLHLLRYAPPSSSSTARLRPGTVYRPSPYSARMQPTKGQKSVVAAAFHQDDAAAAGKHGDDGIAATSILHLVADDDDVAPELPIGGGALQSPNGRPGPPREGSGGKIHHAAPPTTVAERARGPTPPGLPAEGSGGNGGSKH